MPLRFDFTPMVFTLIQLLPSAKSQRRSWGKPFTVLTTTSTSPSLSKSPKAQPREAFGIGDAGAAPVSVTSSNRPLRRLR